MGKLDQLGRFHPDPEKMRVFVVPANLNSTEVCPIFNNDNNNGQLRPYVSHTTPQVRRDAVPNDLHAYYAAALENDTTNNINKK